jgi:ubiquitin-like-conjugating enzyme ATG10
MWYLAKEHCHRVIHKELQPVDHFANTLTLEQSVAEEQEEAATTVPVETGCIRSYHYHILYSASYAAPVLYFNVFGLGMMCDLMFQLNTHTVEDGVPLGLEEVWTELPHRYQNKDTQWTFITQKVLLLSRTTLNIQPLQEHPLLGVPFYHLHPCETSKLMALVLNNKQKDSVEQKSGNYLFSWLSLVAPIVRLALPLEMAVRLNNTKQ